MTAEARPDDAGGAREPLRLAFVCVRNAGRSQMAAALAERERRRRDLGDDVVVLSGGVDPADAVHDVVREVMRETDADLSGRTPREIAADELAACDYVVTMGCSTLDLDVGPAVELREWSLPDPEGRDPAAVRTIRDEIAGGVRELFDDLERAVRTSARE